MTARWSCCCTASPSSGGPGGTSSNRCPEQAFARSPPTCAATVAATSHRAATTWSPAASDVAGLVRALGEANAIVVGHDWGGLVAWTVGAYFPKVVRRLGVVSVAHPLRMRGAMFTEAVSRRRNGHMLAFQLPIMPERQLVRDNAELVGRMLTDWSAPGWPDDRDGAGVSPGHPDPVGGPLGPGVLPLVFPLHAASRRHAVHPPDAGAHPGPDPAGAWGPGHLRTARVARAAPDGTWKAPIGGG